MDQTVSRYRCERCFGPSDTPICAPCALRDTAERRRRALGLGPPVHVVGDEDRVVIVSPNTRARWVWVVIGACLLGATEIAGYAAHWLWLR